MVVAIYFSFFIINQMFLFQTSTGPSIQCYVYFILFYSKYWPKKIGSPYWVSARGDVKILVSASAIKKIHIDPWTMFVYVHVLMILTRHKQQQEVEIFKVPESSS